MIEQDLLCQQGGFFFLSFITREQGGNFYLLHEICEQGGKLVKRACLFNRHLRVD